MGAVCPGHVSGRISGLSVVPIERLVLGLRMMHDNRMIVKTLIDYHCFYIIILIMIIRTT